MKRKILEILEENKGESVSGSEIGRRLGMTRAAVWKGVKALQEEGFQIQAVTNRGYCLAAESDILSEAAIRRHLHTRVLGHQIELYQKLDSTNIRAKAAAQEHVAAGLCVVAEEQSAGRGRLGRSFASPKGNGVYMSVVLRPGLALSQTALITAATAVCVARAIEALVDCTVGIKWVNDLFVNGKKVCGILTEAAIEFESKTLDYAVIGIGVNLSEQGFSETLKEIAGGIVQNGKMPERGRLIAEILNQMEPVLEKPEALTWLEEYRQRSVVVGREVSVLWDGAAVGRGTALSIDEEARLVVQLENGEIQHLNSGEISCKIV